VAKKRKEKVFLKGKRERTRVGGYDISCTEGREKKLDTSKGTLLQRKQENPSER